jgi:O-antigen/teichoic acid export membrane protein
MSTTFFFGSFGLVPTTLLTKNMNFKAIAIIGICTLAIAGPISVFLAFSGYGVWSLAWNTVLSAAIAVAFTWIYSRWVPHFSLDLKQVKELLGFGMNLTGSNFVGYFARNLDNLLIGRFLGATPLGFYNLAYNLLLIPLGNVSDVFGRVMFPALSIIQHDKQMVSEAYVTANRYIAAVAFPMMIWLLVVAPELIRVVYGPKWISAIPLVQILALTALLQSISITVGWIFLSQGRTDILFRLSVFTTTVNAVAFIVGLNWGVEGVAIGYTISSYLVAYPIFAVAFGLIDLKVRYFIAKLSPIILATLTLGIIAFLFRISLERLGITHDVTILVIVTVASLLCYSVLVFLLDRELFTETVELIRQLISGHSESTLKEG